MRLSDVNTKCVACGRILSDARQPFAECKDQDGCPLRALQRDANLKVLSFLYSAGMLWVLWRIWLQLEGAPFSLRLQVLGLATLALIIGGAFLMHLVMRVLKRPPDRALLRGWLENVPLYLYCAGAFWVVWKFWLFTNISPPPSSDRLRGVVGVMVGLLVGGALSTYLLMRLLKGGRFRWR